MKLRAIIVDDEQDAVDNLNYILSHYCPTVEVIASFASPLAALQRIPGLEPDLLFLDIEMPRLSGFDLLDQLESRDFQVIFITSYNQYAMRAIRYSALDYLLKPIDIEELTSSVERAFARQQLHQPLQPHLDQLGNLLKGYPLDKIALPFQSGYRFIPVSSLVLVEADGRYSRVYTDRQEELLVSINLKEFDDMLSGARFYRVHHAFLINIAHMSAYHRTDGGYVEMDNGKSIPISRRKKQAFEQLLKTMLPGSSSRG